MSLGYCLKCLEPAHVDVAKCLEHGDEIIYGELRVAYIRGYRDAQAGLEPQL